MLSFCETALLPSVNSYGEMTRPDVDRLLFSTYYMPGAIKNPFKYMNSLKSHILLIIIITPLCTNADVGALRTEGTYPAIRQVGDKFRFLEQVYWFSKWATWHPSLFLLSPLSCRRSVLTATPAPCRGLPLWATAPNWGHSWDF